MAKKKKEIIEEIEEVVEEEIEVMEINLDIDIEAEGHEDLLSEDEITDFVSRVIISQYDSKKPIYMSLLITNDEEIQVVNREHRGIDAPTDVISFAYHDGDDFDVGAFDTLGDIIISVDRVVEQAHEYGHSEKRELYYLITHGILHLLGYDHMTPEDRAEMRLLEEEILLENGLVIGHLSEDRLIPFNR